MLLYEKNSLRPPLDFYLYMYIFLGGPVYFIFVFLLLFF